MCFVKMECPINVAFQYFSWWLIFWRAHFSFCLIIVFPTTNKHSFFFSLRSTMAPPCLKCPNPLCSFEYKSSRALSVHFLTLRGQYCQAVQASSSISLNGSSRPSVSHMTIHEYNRNRHNNYTSFMSLVNTTEASTSNAMGGHIGANMYPNENNNHNDNDMIDVVEPMNR